MNYFTNIWNELKNESTYKAICGLCAVIFLIFCVGCPITTRSIFDPNTRVSPEELQAEIDNFYLRQESEYNSFIAKAKNRVQDINDQIAIRDFVYNQTISAVQTGSLNWLGLLTGAGTIVGFGALADNIRYRIRTSKKSSNA